MIAKILILAYILWTSAIADATEEKIMDVPTGIGYMLRLLVIVGGLAYVGYFGGS